MKTEDSSKRIPVVDDKENDMTYNMPEKDILRAIEKYFSKKDLEKDLTDIQEILKLTEKPPVVRFTSAIIADAVKMKASDIHVEPWKNTPGRR
jgi:type II secretory ATPase GspE/PulE/Tfp pilus assembly ATPase PilB-like protein